jgi:hypothetical protein
MVSSLHVVLPKYCIPLKTRYHPWSKWWMWDIPALRLWVFRTLSKAKSTVFSDIAPCSLLSVNRRFGGTYRFHVQGRKNKLSKKSAWKQVASRMLSRWFLAQLIFLPWRWRRYVPPKRRLTLNGLHGRFITEFVWLWNMGAYVRVDSKRFWLCCIALKLTGFSDFVWEKEIPRMHFKNFKENLWKRWDKWGMKRGHRCNCAATYNVELR